MSMSTARYQRLRKAKTALSEAGFFLRQDDILVPGEFKEEIEIISKAFNKLDKVLKDEEKSAYKGRPSKRA